MFENLRPRWLLSLIVGSSLVLCTLPAVLRPLFRSSTERLVQASLAAGAPLTMAAKPAKAAPAAPAAEEDPGQPAASSAWAAGVTLSAPPAREYLSPDAVPAPAKEAPRPAAQVSDAPVTRWNARIEEVSGGNGRLRWPLQGLLTSRFGPRGRGYHRGIDVAAPYGREVRAAAAGIVVEAGWATGLGRRVVIDHGDGFQTVYAHFSRILVSQGQRVARGEVIGLVGTSGWSTGPHLHFEVHVGGRAMNPLRYLD